MFEETKLLSVCHISSLLLITSAAGVFDTVPIGRRRRRHCERGFGTVPIDPAVLWTQHRESTSPPRRRGRRSRLVLCFGWPITFLVQSTQSTIHPESMPVRNMFEGTCDDKHETYDAKYATFSSTSVRGGREPFLAVFPECAECTMKRSVVQVLFSEKSKDMNTFQTNFSKHFPECEVYPPSGLPLGLPITLPLSTVVSRTRRRLGQRYALCNITSSGHYELSGNCSITQTIKIGEGDVLELIGISGPDGTKPAIDGGWDGVQRSNTGIQLFDIQDKGTLQIDNMILTHGEVRFQL